MTNIHNNKQVIILGRNHYGRVPMHELQELMNNNNEHLQPIKCRRCGSTKDVMLNGYCIDCEEELSGKIV
jgi:hypothetical protein